MKKQIISSLIIKLIKDLGWDYDRLSSSGQATYDTIIELITNNEIEQKREVEWGISILRSTESSAINIPSKVWKEAGWELNDVVRLFVCENFNDNDDKWHTITIERKKDIEKFNHIINTTGATT